MRVGQQKDRGKGLTSVIGQECASGKQINDARLQTEQRLSLSRQDTNVLADGTGDVQVFRRNWSAVQGTGAVLGMLVGPLNRTGATETGLTGCCEAAKKRGK